MTGEQPGDAKLRTEGSGTWAGVGFILEYDTMEPGDVGFIINVPGGAVGINDLRTAAAAPDLLDALRTLKEAATYLSACMATKNRALHERADKMFCAALGRANVAIAKASGAHS